MVVNDSVLCEINGCSPLLSVGEWRPRDPGHPSGWRLFERDMWFHRISLCRWRGQV